MLKAEFSSRPRKQNRGQELRITLEPPANISHSCGLRESISVKSNFLPIFLPTAPSLLSAKANVNS